MGITCVGIERFRVVQATPRILASRSHNRHSALPRDVRPSFANEAERIVRV